MPKNTLQYKDNGVFYNSEKLLTETDNIFLDVSDLRSTIGTTVGQLDLGTFTGALIPDNSTVKQALQTLETAHENISLIASNVENAIVGNITSTNLQDVITDLDTTNTKIETTLGVNHGDTHLGTFTGSIISDNSNVKSALQEVETYLDSATFSKWTSDNTNSVVKLTNLSDEITARTVGTEFAIKDNGNVGIANTNPTAKLEVTGNVKITTRPNQTSTTGKKVLLVDSITSEIQETDATNIFKIDTLTAKTTSPDNTSDYIAIFENSSGNVLKINKQDFVQNEVLYNAGALSGAVPAGKELGIDTTTGTFYYKNGSGNWQQQPVGTQVNLIDNADGTLTINASLGGTEKTIRPISELTALVGSVDNTNDKLVIYDTSASQHVTVRPDQIGVIPNVRFGTVAPTVLGTDKKGDEYLITPTGDNTTTSTAGYVFDGTQWNIRAGGTAQSEMSLTGDGTTANKIKLVNDNATPGNYKVYGTNNTGAKGWQSAAVTVTVGQIQAFATSVIPQRV